MEFLARVRNWWANKHLKMPKLFVYRLVIGKKDVQEMIENCGWIASITVFWLNRMECLEKVEKREADFLAVDPEDMYVAFQTKNTDFSVFSEIRTVEEPNGNSQWSFSNEIFSTDFSPTNLELESEWRF